MSKVDIRLDTSIATVVSETPLFIIAYAVGCRSFGKSSTFGAIPEGFTTAVQLAAFASIRGCKQRMTG
jgi:hypothetical protein